MKYVLIIANVALLLMFVGALGRALIAHDTMALPAWYYLTVAFAMATLVGNLIALTKTRHAS